jgi:prevent-host-death family protein
MNPQIVPITDFRIRQGEVLTKLSKGPVFLAQRSKPAAVLVSMREWEQIQEELKRFRRHAEADEILADMKAGSYLTQEEFDAELSRP